MGEAIAQPHGVEKVDVEAALYEQAKAHLTEGTYSQQVEDEIDSLLDKWEELDLEEEVEIDNLLEDRPTIVSSAKQELLPSQWTEFAINLAVAGGIQNFSFAERQYLKPIYDTPGRRVLLKCGRQVEKSTMLGNICLTYATLNPAFKTIYVSATAQQATVFSVDRIREVIEISDVITSLTNTKLAQNVFFKQFRNRSQIRFRYAFLSADRVRGIPADLVLVDEIQDIIASNIPVIEECASHSTWKLFRYSGTPKSLDNTIQVYWDQYSTQNEWMVPCEACNNWNILGERNIGKRGLICAKCRRPINVNHPKAQWAAQQPVTVQNEDKVAFEGYRIPQIMVPWIVHDPESWKGILLKQSQYDRAQFHNEVLGLSYDSGVRPLTRRDVQSACKENIHFNDVEENARGCSQVFAGIDWGCHDEDTRILTQDGWKHFRDLADSDQVMQWDPNTREMSLAAPEVRTIRDWNEPLYHFKTKGALDLMVTGTHRMRVGRQDGSNWITESASDTAERGGNVRFVGHVGWVGDERDTFQLPGLPVSSGYQGCDHRTFNMDDWLEFLGYVLSEGGVCLKRNAAGDLVPYHMKMSQRETVSAETTELIRECMERMHIPFSEFPDPSTGDVNWSINGKQFWHWFYENMGPTGDTKRIPRQFLELGKRQLRILFDAMVAGDGYVDPRENCESGAYYSTSRGLCEDFQELCIRLGMRCVVRLHKPASGNRKTRWRAMWSRGRDFQFNTPRQKIERIEYSGKVYCCKVPSGYIVTERNGCVAYQGNTGENSFTVLALGAYMNNLFQIFFVHRFTGPELEPPIQLDMIARLLSQVNFTVAGTDYGGGYDRNHFMVKNFGPRKVWKYQYAARPNQKVSWQPKLQRFILHRSEIMSDIFSAIKDKKIGLPNWREFQSPYAEDLLNIFSEYNNQLRMIQYKVSPGKTDDTFHAILYCFLASMLVRRRPDVIVPMKEGDVDIPL